MIAIALFRRRDAGLSTAAEAEQAARPRPYPWRTCPDSGHPIGFVSARQPSTPADDGEIITYSGDGHIITIAPTGTGKTAGPVICNALIHPGQLIVLDIKGEVYRATARHRREMGQKVHVLDLSNNSKSSDALNPLDLAARCGSEAATIARGFAAELIERGHERDRFWNDWAETLIAAGVTWLLDDCARVDRHLSKFFDLLTDGDVDLAIEKLLAADEVSSRAAIAGFNGYLQLPERETRPSVLGTALQHLRLFDSNLVRRVTKTTTIDLDALIAGMPMTIYLIVPPSRLTAFRPLLRTWLTGLLYALTQRTTLPEHRTLMLCDEIASLGRMEAFLMASTLMRGWGLTLWSIWQNPSQLEIYGHQARTIVDNAGVLQLFGARNRRMAQDFAALVGGIDPDAIMAMPRDGQLLMMEGEPPRVSSRMEYFKEPMFQGLYDANPMFSRQR